MTYAVAAVLVLLALVFALNAFATSNPAAVARSVRLAGPAVLGLLGAALLGVGLAGPGGLMMAVAFGWFALARRKTVAANDPKSSKRSSVRTAALEMELDHETGGLEGLVLAGRHEQRMLSTMSLPHLIELYADLRSDSESRQLLETYLDGRFPVWRQNAKAQIGPGQGVAPGSGAMTKQEAYKVLGLEAGATAADIRKAHRRLMQRLHSDIGRSSVLAARINEAKDILLTNHH